MSQFGSRTLSRILAVALAAASARALVLAWHDPIFRGAAARAAEIGASQAITFDMLLFAAFAGAFSHRPAAAALAGSIVGAVCGAIRAERVLADTLPAASLAGSMGAGCLDTLLIYAALRRWRNEAR